MTRPIVIRGACGGSGRGSPAPGSASSKDGRGLGWSTTGSRGALPSGLIGAGARRPVKGNRCRHRLALFRRKDCRGSDRRRGCARHRLAGRRRKDRFKSCEAGRRRVAGAHAQAPYGPRFRGAATSRRPPDQAAPADRGVSAGCCGSTGVASTVDRSVGSGVSAAGRPTAGRGNGVGVTRRGSRRIISDAGISGGCGGRQRGRRARHPYGRGVAGLRRGFRLALLGVKAGEPGQLVLLEDRRRALDHRRQRRGLGARRPGIQQALQIPVHALAIRPLRAWRSASISRT